MGGAEGAFENVFGCGGEDDVGGAVAAPAAVDREENFREFCDEGGLLIGSEHQVAVAFVGVGESREDAAVDAKVGGTHVGGFFGALEGKGDAAEVIHVHDGVEGGALRGGPGSSLIAHA